MVKLGAKNWQIVRMMHHSTKVDVAGSSTAQTFQAMMLGPILSMTGRKTMGNMLVKPNQNDLVVMKALIEAGKVVPVIDRRYPLSQAPEAFCYIEEGHGQGKVVITIAKNGSA